MLPYSLQLARQMLLPSINSLSVIFFSIRDRTTYDAIHGTLQDVSPGSCTTSRLHHRSNDLHKLPRFITCPTIK